MPAGRPTKYKKEYAKTAEELCKRIPLTDIDLGLIFGVSEVTINAWKQEHPEFLKSLKRGKEFKDAQVVKSLFERATGYEHPEDKIFNNNGKPMVVPTVKHYPPDPTALIFWLKNRQPGQWRDKQDIALGFDSATVDLLLSKFPPEYADAVKKALVGGK